MKPGPKPGAKKSAEPFTVKLVYGGLQLRYNTCQPVKARCSEVFAEAFMQAIKAKKVRVL